MTTVILRGFDVPIEDLKDRFRLCNPLLSFEHGGSAPIFRARHLNWQASSDVELLVPIEVEDAHEFCTLFRDHDRSIAAGYGVLVMHRAFSEALSSTRVTEPTELQFVQELDCYVGVATDEEFDRYEIAIVEQAKDVVDRELVAGYPVQFSEIGQLALRILRRCRSARSTDVAMRQLAVALVSRKPDLYRRLLIRFSIDLQEPEEGLDQRVHRHLALVGRRRMRNETERWEVAQHSIRSAPLIGPSASLDKRIDELFAGYSPYAAAERSEPPGNTRYMSGALNHVPQPQQWRATGRESGAWFDEDAPGASVRSDGLSNWILDTERGPHRPSLLDRNMDMLRTDMKRLLLKDRQIGWQSPTHETV